MNLEAASAPKFKLYVAVMFLIWALGSYSFYQLFTKPQLKSASEAPVVLEEKEIPFSVDFSNYKQDVTLNLEKSEGFKFATGSADFVKPVPMALYRNLVNIKDFMALNKQARLEITGLYQSNEKNNTAFPSLGLARANQVKSFLQSKGFDLSRVNISGALGENFVPDSKGVFSGMVDFSFNKISAAWLVNEKQSLSRIEKRITRKPLVVNFNTGDASINLSKPQREKILHLVKFLDKSPERKLKLVGHTDSKGDASENKKLAKDRAHIIADYLEKNGLTRKRMVIVSAGESKPIASNKTAEGRRKNRRTVISLN